MAERRNGGTADGSATLVIQTAFLGDVVLTTPLLSALADKFGPVDVVVTPDAATLLQGHPAVREVIRYDKKGREAGLRGLWRMGPSFGHGDTRGPICPTAPGGRPRSPCWPACRSARASRIVPPRLLIPRA